MRLSSWTAEQGAALRIGCPVPRAGKRQKRIGVSSDNAKATAPATKTATAGPAPTARNSAHQRPRSRCQRARQDNCYRMAFSWRLSAEIYGARSVRRRTHKVGEFSDGDGDDLRILTDLARAGMIVALRIASFRRDAEGYGAHAIHKRLAADPAIVRRRALQRRMGKTSCPPSVLLPSGMPQQRSASEMRQMRPGKEPERHPRRWGGCGIRR